MRIFSLTGMTFCLSPLLLSGCGGEVLSPEDRIREMLSAGEKAFEGRSVSEVGRFLSEQYLDDTGRQRGQLQKLLAGYFLTHQSIHLLMQINRIEFTGESTAETTLFVALAGRWSKAESPISSRSFSGNTILIPRFIRPATPVDACCTPNSSSPSSRWP